MQFQQKKSKYKSTISHKAEVHSYIPNELLIQNISKDKNTLHTVLHSNAIKYDFIRKSANINSQ